MQFVVQSSAAILILLAMAAFAGRAPLRPMAAGWVLLGAACAGILTHFLLLADAALLGSLVVALVCAQLWTRFSRVAAPLGLGLLAVAWAQWLTYHGIATFMAGAIAIGVLVGILWACQRRMRSPDAALQAEALLIVLIVAVFVAATPAVISGWRSAVALNAVEQSPVSAAMPGGGVVWMLIAVAPLVAGAMYSRWRRNRRC